MSKTYILNEEQPGLFTFEGRGGTVTLEQLKALRTLQPDALWIIFAEPSTIISNQLNNNDNE